MNDKKNDWKYNEEDWGFIRKLFEELWSNNKAFTYNDVSTLIYKVQEIDNLCDKIKKQLREEVVPATLSGKNENLRKKLVFLSVSYWEIREQIKDAKRIIEKVANKLE